MFYMVITKYDKVNNLYFVVTVDGASYNVNSVVGFATEEQIVNASVMKGLTPLNFSIDRNNNIKEDCGAFTRLSDTGCAVVLAELKTKRGKTLGYRLLSCSNNQVVNLKTEDIVARAQSQENPFLHNGIVRNNTVNCYPLHKYPVIEIGNENNRESGKRTRGIRVPRQATQYRKPVAKDFNSAQSVELQRCKERGIDTSLINNPDLSEKQMRVLWVSKSKGALAEYYNDPRLSVDAMKFYGDRIVDESVAKECQLMLSHPELSVDELNELYKCVCDGVDYSNFIGMTPTNIDVEREKQTREYWGTSSMFDVDYYDKALNVARQLKGF